MSQDLDGNLTAERSSFFWEKDDIMTAGLDDWKVETSNGRNILFYKGKNYITQKYRTSARSIESIPRS